MHSTTPHIADGCDAASARLRAGLITDPRPPAAPDILSQAQAALRDRAETYDAPRGERSMTATVAMFNALTGLGLSDQQGWAFMVCLKLARSERGKNHIDSFVDAAAYCALAGESAAA